MGLLMSDSLLPDRLLDAALRLLDGLGELAYAGDATCDGHEHETSDPSKWPRPRQAVSRREFDDSTPRLGWRQ